MSKIDFTEFLQDHTIDETIKVLDDILYLLVLKTEYQGVADNLVHQYLVIRGLRDVIAKLN